MTGVRLWIALALSTAPAFAADVPSCAAPLGSAQAVFAQAEADGYVMSDPGSAIAPEVAERLRWIVAMPYLAGDTGGAGLADLLAQQARAAQNLTRLVDTAHSATRVFARDDEAVMIIRWQEDAAGRIFLRCAGASFRDDGDAIAPSGGRFGDISRAAFGPLPEGASAGVEVFAPDHAAIREHAPGTTPPFYIKTIVMRYTREVLK